MTIKSAIRTLAARRALAEIRRRALERRGSDGVSPLKGSVPLCYDGRRGSWCANDGVDRRIRGMTKAQARTSVAILVVLVGPGFRSGEFLSAAEPTTALPDFRGSVEPGRPTIVEVPPPTEARVRSIVIAIRQPGRMKPAESLACRVDSSGPRSRCLLRKALDLADPDLAGIVQQATDEPLRITVAVSGPREPPPAPCCRADRRPRDRPRTRRSPQDGGRRRAAVGGARRFRNRAERLARLGQPPGPGPDRLRPGRRPALLDARPGCRWRGARAGDRLVSVPVRSDRTPGSPFSVLDFVDRDVPPDVRIFQSQDEQARGIHPGDRPAEPPARAAAAPGRQQVHHARPEPGHATSSASTPASPSTSSGPSCSTSRPTFQPEHAATAAPEAVASAARKAVRTAMDFQLLAGDSWHANTPRKGHPTDRVANFHHETSTCVACHPTHFTTQSAMAAVKAGYPIEQPFALQFLTERLANNPVPFHGHPEALWARMIPAPANVLGRLSTIVHGLTRTASPARAATTSTAASPSSSSSITTAATSCRRTRPTATTPSAATRSPPIAGGSSTRSPAAPATPRYAQTRDLVAKLLPTGQAGQHPRPGRPDDRPLPDRPEAAERSPT